jgi:hypothetical protein
MTHKINADQFYGYLGNHSLASEVGNGKHKALTVRITIGVRGVEAEFQVLNHNKPWHETKSLENAVDAYNDL